MTQSQEASRSDKSYFSNVENIAEMARLVRQGQLYTKIAGGSLAGLEQYTHRFHDVLDLACGPGEWVLDVAAQLPSVRVVGADVSQLMTDYAQHLVGEQGLNNVQFRRMDIMHPLDFPDASFDLVNARLVCAFMTADYWPVFLHECLRITRPGGIIRMTECERWFANTPAFERFACLLVQAFHRAGKTFSPTDTVQGVTLVLGQLLRRAGCHNVQTRSFTVDFSAGAEAYGALYEDAASLFRLTQPFMVKMGVVSKEEVSVLYAQALAEMQSPDFCGMWPYVCAYGEKPE